MNLNIGWLYPDLMSTYGDRGNIITLNFRSQKRRIETKIHKISLLEPGESILQMDLLFMGGAQDKQQEIVNQDLQKNKGGYLEKAIFAGTPSLNVCGAYQFLGNYYLAADETRIKGLGIFDLYTKSPGLNFPRCIGNLIVESYILPGVKLVGFENHGGRTYVNDRNLIFAKVLKGFGNNGEDGQEGFIFKNAIGTYLHGPILPKNPELADWLIEKALERKYGKKIKLAKLDNYFENKAKETIIKRYT
ncbi:cobalamin biosynthesis protein CobQ [Candidatus Roizmanbacteria bacterium]|nr:cobalamin biosynthesis protein CobQ [Candidatus Roizmanbacteria bacterium]